MSVDKSLQSLARKLNRYSKYDAPRAAARSLNTCARRVTTQTVRSVSRATKVQGKHIRSRMFTDRATPKKQMAKVSIKPRDISAVKLLSPAKIERHLGQGTNRRGVRVAGQQFGGAFINKVKGRANVFIRRSGSRYPLDVVKIPIKNESKIAINRFSLRVMRQDFPGLLKKDLQFRLKKYEK